MCAFGPPLLEFKEICKRYKKRTVLGGISFSISYGEIFGLVGPSGGGKTTLLKILMGMIHPDSGKVLFEQKNVNKKTNYLRKNSGFATQDNLLFEELSVEENCFYFGKMYGVKRAEIKDNFQQLLSLLSLKGFENTPVKHLSGGMNKRANLLVSLIHKPKLLILDEPTVGLDPLLRKNLWDYIHQINETGTTILITSHLLQEIEQNCNTIAILKGGKIVDVGSPEQFRAAYGKDKSFEEIFSEVMTT